MSIGIIAAIVSILFAFISFFATIKWIGAVALLAGIIGLVFGIKKKGKLDIILSVVGLAAATVSCLLWIF